MSGTGFAVIDIETTGLDPHTDRVVEIAVLHLDRALQETGRWQSLVDPGRDTGAVHIHGITTAHVTGAPTFADIATALADRLASRLIVAHNAQFDRAFLNREFERAGVPHRLGDESWVCTMDQSRIYLEPGSHSLRGLADRLHIVPGRAHRALGDALTCADIFRTFVRFEQEGRRYTDVAVNRDDAEVRPAQWARARPWNYSR
ncbi:3'-5' exonuclease [Trueperella bialowiezensis]|uniref:DNA polymerase III polC-type n=1 Tax=Trueperella bialowiezensis TaxID=312285 RepID=A0A3S4VEP5_9ACTO|nr:3'-5' exonuclease [Trueperella bialowiezensis]VEI12519.1 DNA polymerase III polC-type [Trueperella bialowiezensis]